ncbi:hypothetical protein [Halostella sp. PRR32]|uniref:hypothetical protein n=2 Tax=Halostella TaxID=1843185 RepID=UPI002B1D3895|nr:hypothetical protein [Halostella sp. PRR32]
MQDEQQYYERRTYGPNEHFEHADVTDEHEDVGDLRRGGQARHSPGDESHEGWAERDMAQSRRGESGSTDRGESNQRRAGSNHPHGGSNRRDTDQRRSGSNQSQRGSETRSGSTNKRYGRRSRELSGSRGDTLSDSQESDDDSGGFLSSLFGSDEETTNRDREAGGRDRGDRTESGRGVGDYARRNRDMPQHTNAGESAGTGANDRQTNRRQAGTDEEGRTDRAGFGDIGPLGGEDARQDARQQGGGETPNEYRETRTQGQIPEGERHGSVTEQTLDRGTTSHSSRHEFGGHSAGDTGTTGRAHRGTESADRTDSGTDRQHGSRRRSQSRNSNPSQGSQRGSHREEGLTGRVGGHFGNPPAEESPEQGGERQFGGERGRSERDHQFGSRRGHGSQRRARFGEDRDEEDRSRSSSH